MTATVPSLNSTQATTLKRELTGAQQELNKLRQENERLQREREQWEAQLAAERQRAQSQVQLQPAAAAAAMRPARSQAPTPARSRGLASREEEPMPDLRFVPPSPVAIPPPPAAEAAVAQRAQEPPAGYPGLQRPEFVESKGPRFLTPSAARGPARTDSAFAPAPRGYPPKRSASSATPSAPPAALVAAPAAAAAPASQPASWAAPPAMPAESAVTYTAQPWAASAAADGGRWSAGSAYSDPATEPWYSMQRPAQQAQQQQQPRGGGGRLRAAPLQFSTWDQPDPRLGLSRGYGGPVPSQVCIRAPERVLVGVQGCFWCSYLLPSWAAWQ